MSKTPKSMSSRQSNMTYTVKDHNQTITLIRKKALKNIIVKPHFSTNQQYLPRRFAAKTVSNKIRPDSSNSTDHKKSMLHTNIKITQKRYKNENNTKTFATPNVTAPNQQLIDSDRRAASNGT